jgi:hypothetical protein
MGNVRPQQQARRVGHRRRFAYRLSASPRAAPRTASPAQRSALGATRRVARTASSDPSAIRSRRATCWCPPPRQRGPATRRQHLSDRTCNPATCEFAARLMRPWSSWNVYRQRSEPKYRCFLEDNVLVTPMSVRRPRLPGRCDNQCSVSLNGRARRRCRRFPPACWRNRTGSDNRCRCGPFECAYQCRFRNRRRLIGHGVGVSSS